MRILYLLIICLALFNAPIFARDLGEMGPVYTIRETNLLEYIYTKLNQLNKTGKINELQKEFARRVEATAIRPAGINLPAALKNTTRLYDPSLVLTKNIKNEKGMVIAKAGTRVNPLEYITLSKELVFINGDRDNEIDFAKSKIAENSNNKIILVSGNIKIVNIKVKSAVFFDQEARLINRFDITHTPSVIAQENDKLTIAEIAL